MEKYFWDSKFDYLLETRKRLWNDDYFKFLVKDVWKLNHPIDIIDFGCGYGYLGLELLPIIPADSTYTGLDISKVLIEKAKVIFKDCPYKTNFMNMDLDEYAPEERYDVAICQAVLRHLPNGKQILKKMVDSVKKGGIVITIEVNRRIEDSGLYIEGLEDDLMEKTHYMERMWLYEKYHGKREYDFGSKVPVYMKEMGLKNIEVRLNDRVDFLDHDSSDYSVLKRELDRNYLNEIGLNEEEIEKFLILNKKINKAIDSKNNAIICANGLMISFGVK